MHESIQDAPDRILSLARVALMQANNHAAFNHLYNQDTDKMSVLNAAHAGELTLKAIIATEHPLLIFRNLFEAASDLDAEFDMTALLRKGQTHDYSKLPNVMWACCQQAVPNLELYKKIGKLRNQIQHFVAPNDSEYRSLSLRFIFECIDPLLQRNFGINAVECHEDDTPEHLIIALIEREILFHPPNDFEVCEYPIAETFQHKSDGYKDSLRPHFADKGLGHLLEM